MKTVKRPSKFPECVYSFVMVDDAFRTYVRFTPTTRPPFGTEGNIPVTLGVIEWSWLGYGATSEQVWYVSDKREPAVPSTGSDEFPSNYSAESEI